MSVGGSKSKQSTNQTTSQSLPPNVMNALDFLVSQTLNVGQGGGFNEAAYLEANPDVARVAQQDNWASHGYTPYDHYLEYGQYENREGVPDGFMGDSSNLTPTLSGDTQSGLDMLRNPNYRGALAELEGTVAG